MSIDPNKIISIFTDCKGTCKTPIGCTCGKQEDEKLETEVVVLQEVVEIVTETKLIKPKSILSIANDEKARLCGCGKSETGFCECKAKKAQNGSVGCCSGTNKLEVFDWMKDIPEMMKESKMVEVQFKNTRKGYYLNSTNLELSKGDVVAVEATPGHDIGEVTLMGKLVDLQMKKANYRGEIKRVYRIAKQNDLEKYEQAKAKEHKTMLRAREIAEELQLDMKISDIEYQGDGNKAIFYYIADGRVDFRQLIKYYASEFRIKIEMKQIGARQEAGRVGGIGPCGRELCCSSSMSNFVSVSTQAARIQDIPLNPQKLAGQCGKLKCCLNFEVDTYVEAQRKLPARDTILETKDSSYFHFKTDVLSGMMTYSTDKYFAANLVTLPRERVFDIINQNKKGDKPLTLVNLDLQPVVENGSLDVLEDSITRFDSDDKQERSQKRRNKKRRGPRQPENSNREQVRDNNRTKEEGAQKRQPRKKLSKPNNNQQANKVNPKEEPQQALQINRKPNRNNNPQEKDKQQQPQNKNPKNARRRNKNQNKNPKE